MKAKPIRQTYESRDRPLGCGQTIALLAALVLTVGTTGPLRAAVIDDMSGPGPRWSGQTLLGPLTANYKDGQLWFTGQFPSAYPYSIGGIDYTVNALSNVDLDGRTLEVRVDVVSVTENEVFVYLVVSGEEATYMLLTRRGLRPSET